MKLPHLLQRDIICKIIVDGIHKQDQVLPSDRFVVEFFFYPVLVAIWVRGGDVNNSLKESKPLRSVVISTFLKI